MSFHAQPIDRLVSSHLPSPKPKRVPFALPPDLKNQPSRVTASPTSASVRPATTAPLIRRLFAAGRPVGP
jgi:hypothetical protein